MKRTMFSTPVLREIAVTISRICLQFRGWKLQGELPTEPKYVIIAVPHTTNWDFPLSLAIAFMYRLDMRWMGKSSLFKGWRGPIMRWLGGIPVNRSASTNMVSQTVEKFKASEELAIAIPPEGTRARVDEWKTGFYYIATGADIPIAMGFLDYKKKVGGFLPTFYPTGDIKKDIAEMRKCYEGISGKYLDKCTVE